jgi:hypothetical protein
MPCSYAEAFTLILGKAGSPSRDRFGVAAAIGGNQEIVQLNVRRF